MYAPIAAFEFVAERIDSRMIGYAFGTPYVRPEAVWHKAVRIYLELWVTTLPGTLPSGSSGETERFYRSAYHPGEAPS